jgi:hypothetical protein
VVTIEAAVVASCGVIERLIPEEKQRRPILNDLRVILASESDSTCSAYSAIRLQAAGLNVTFRDRPCCWLTRADPPSLAAV